MSSIHQNPYRGQMRFQLAISIIKHIWVKILTRKFSNNLDNHGSFFSQGPNLDFSSFHHTSQPNRPNNYRILVNDLMMDEYSLNKCWKRFLIISLWQRIKEKFTRESHSLVAPLLVQTIHMVFAIGWWVKTNEKWVKNLGFSQIKPNGMFGLWNYLILDEAVNHIFISCH